MKDEKLVAKRPEPWTKRGEMLPVDRKVIEATANKNHSAARIFVTGEVSEAYIGDLAVRHLLSINDVLYGNNAGCEPLFVQTRSETIRMLRFDPEFVWRCFHPDILVSLVQDEIARLGVDMDPWQMDYFDFYQNMIAAIKQKSGDAAIAVIRKESSIDDFYHVMYLSCLLLFGKPGYMDVPVAEHFAQPAAAQFLCGSEVYTLNMAAEKELNKLRENYGELRTLTNFELKFVVDLIEKRLLCS
jgi:hypothetical protein